MIDSGLHGSLLKRPQSTPQGNFCSIRRLNAKWEIGHGRDAVLALQQTNESRPGRKRPDRIQMPEMRPA
jgi:hypothetical protein